MAVYFIQAGEGGPIKIGCAIQPAKRMQELQTGNALKLRLRAVVPGSLEVERRLHDWFSEWRMQGEWFQPSHALEGFIAGVTFCHEEYAALQARVARDEELDEV